MAGIASAVSQVNPAAFASPGDATAGTELPTAVFGSRDAVLGQPAGWMQLGDYVVPVYRKAGA